MGQSESGTTIEDINGLKDQVKGLEKELAEAHEHYPAVIRGQTRLIEALQQQVKTLREALEACEHEFTLMSDPYMPSNRHLTPMSDMVEMINAAIASATPPVGETPRNYMKEKRLTSPISW